MDNKFTEEKSKMSNKSDEDFNTLEETSGPVHIFSSQHLHSIELSDNPRESIIRSQEIKLKLKESQFLAAIIQDSVCQMLILNNCNRELMESMLKKASNKKWKPQGEEAPPEDRLEKVDLLELASDSHKLAKMESDRKYITDTLIITYLDLKINRSFPSFLVQLSNLAAKAYQAIARELQYNEYRSKLKNIQIKLRKDTSNHKNILNECEIEIYKLLDEIDDSTWNSEIKTRYIQCWQNAQMEQHSLAIDRTERVLVASVSGTELRIQQENRIHSEIEAFIKLTTQDYSDDIETWMKTYDDELEQLDLDIRVLKEKRDFQLEDTAALEKLMAAHKAEMDAWVDFVNERARLKALKELELLSAIRIQSWWRGILAKRLFKKLLKKKRKQEKLNKKMKKKW